MSVREKNKKERSKPAGLETTEPVRSPAIKPLWVYGILLILLAAAYYPLLHCGFISYDDPTYLSSKAMTPGMALHWEGIRWAFTTFYGADWHPVTWLSHMVDYRVYGLNPLGHHLTNFLLHTFSTLLLFALLHRMTGAMWRSAFVAAMFAVHPLHVESVVWISERKDVLSAFFGLLATWFYVRYARTDGVIASVRSSALNYFLALFFFALGLLSKASVITLPFVWMLLDWWPLAGNAVKSKGSGFRGGVAILNKLPFLALSGITSAVTYASHARAVKFDSGDGLSWFLKLSVAVTGYISYLGKLIFPFRLAVFYPLPTEFPYWWIAACAVTLIVVSLVAILLRNKQRWLMVGWFWFLGMLVPVIGLVKIGIHFIADRYTYLPSVGFFILVAWGAYALLRRWPRHQFFLALVAGSAVLSCAIGTAVQTGYWQSNKRLFEHALNVTGNNPVADDQLGMALLAENQPEEARNHFAETIRLDPRSPIGYHHMGILLVRLRAYDDAIAHFRQAIEIAAGNFGNSLASQQLQASAYNSLAEVYLNKGQFEQALNESQNAIRLQPDFAVAIENAGTALALQKRNAEAIQFFESALNLNPDLITSRYNLANLLSSSGKLAEAEEHYRGVVTRQPSHLDAQYELANVLLKQNKLDEAEANYSRTLQVNPDMAEAHYQLGLISARRHKNAEALTHWREAIRLKPGWVEPLNNLSWLLSTCSDGSVRDGREALKLARALEAFTGDKNADTLDTMAAAHAELGQFEEATEYEQRAIAVLSGAKQETRVAAFQQRLELFKAHQPYHE